MESREETPRTKDEFLVVKTFRFRFKHGVLVLALPVLAWAIMWFGQRANHETVLGYVCEWVALTSGELLSKAIVWAIDELDR